MPASTQTASNRSKKKSTANSPSQELSAERLLEMYDTMLTIRSFEEKVAYFFSRGMIHGTTHLYIGEEATAVGVIANLSEADLITSTHRGHGHTIAKGIDINRMMAELLGKESGYCKGKGGSMHIADLDRGNGPWGEPRREAPWGHPSGARHPRAHPPGGRLPEWLRSRARLPPPSARRQLSPHPCWSGASPPWAHSCPRLIGEAHVKQPGSGYVPRDRAQ